MTPDPDRYALSESQERMGAYLDDLLVRLHGEDWSAQGNGTYREPRSGNGLGREDGVNGADCATEE